MNKPIRIFIVFLVAMLEIISGTSHSASQGATNKSILIKQHVIREQDFRAFARELLTLKNSKSEFETFAQYKNRIEGLLRSDYSISIPVNGKENKCSEHPRFTISSASASYDAENSLLNIELQTNLSVNINMTCHSPKMSAEFYYTELAPLNATKFSFDSIAMPPASAKEMISQLLVKINFTIFTPQSMRNRYSLAEDESSSDPRYDHIKNMVVYAVVNNIELINKKTKQVLQSIKYPNKILNECAALEEKTVCSIKGLRDNCISEDKYKYIINRCSQQITVNTDPSRRLHGSILTINPESSIELGFIYRYKDNSEIDLMSFGY